jgi:hypothetical protein
MSGESLCFMFVSSTELSARYVINDSIDPVHSIPTWPFTLGQSVNVIPFAVEQRSLLAFVCQAPDCGRRFSVSSNLRRHEKVSSVRCN